MLTTRHYIRHLCHTQARYAYSTDAASDNLDFPLPQHPNHHDLPSFLEHASRTQLDPTSTTYVGTHFEYIVLDSFRRLGMSLRRMGGKNDYGIDLLGTWCLPTAPQPLKVLLQCKALARKIGPSQARELEGAFVGAPSGWRGPDVVGLLVAQKSATRGVREALGRSRWPMGYVLCNTDGKISQMLWNKKAAEAGLEGIDVGLRYTGGDINEKEVVLTWKGEDVNG